MFKSANAGPAYPILAKCQLSYDLCRGDLERRYPLRIAQHLFSAMSPLGQKRRFGDVRTTPALPPKTDILREGRHVFKVPQTDVASPSHTGRPSIISLTRFDCELAFFKLFAWSLAMGIIGDTLLRALEFLKNPAFDGLRSYTRFATSVQSELRFIRSKESSTFLQEVLNSSQRREIKINKGTTFWRARLGCEYEDGRRAKPYPSAGMKPIPNWMSEGRANPRGIPCLYVATTRETALSEVRPWIGAPISISQLRTVRDLKIIDCSKHHQADAFSKLLIAEEKSKEDGIWTAIDRAFATPVSKEDESKGYIATQVITELFKSEKFDGVKYKSLLAEDGYNLALFSLDDTARVIFGSQGVQLGRPLYPQKRTSPVGPDRSKKCQNRTLGTT